MSQKINLFVSNVPWTISNVEFKNYFSKFGATKAKLTFNRQTGLSRKFGFVTVESKEVYNEIFSRSDHFLEGSFLRIQNSIQAPASISKNLENYEKMNKFEF